MLFGRSCFGSVIAAYFVGHQRVDFEVLFFLRTELSLLLLFCFFRHRQVEVFVGGQRVVFGFEDLGFDESRVDFEEELFEFTHDEFVLPALEAFEGVEVSGEDRDEEVVDPVAVEHLDDQVGEAFELSGLSLGVFFGRFWSAFGHAQDTDGFLEVFELFLGLDQIRYRLEGVS